MLTVYIHAWHVCRCQCVGHCRATATRSSARAVQEDQPGNTSLPIVHALACWLWWSWWVSSLDYTLVALCLQICALALIHFDGAGEQCRQDTSHYGFKLLLLPCSTEHRLYGTAYHAVCRFTHDNWYVRCCWVLWIVVSDVKFVTCISALCVCIHNHVLRAAGLEGVRSSTISRASEWC